MVIRIVLGMAIAASMACSYGGNFIDCEVVCTPSTGCPAGFTCSLAEGLCRSDVTGPSCRDGGVDSISTDGGSTDGGSVDGGAASCPAVFGAARYLFVNTLMEWSAAEDYCKGLDLTPSVAPYVHLVVVTNATELAQLTPTGTPLDDAWLGYTDRKNPSGSSDPATIAANFRWVTDEQPVPVWTSGQPDDSSSPRCAYKNFGNGLMHDRTCIGHTRTFFCECDQFQENPNNL